MCWKKCRQVCVRLGLLCLTFVLHARAQQYHFREFGAQEGLPHSQIEDMIEDREGYLWVATRGGLARWNGFHFETFDEKHGLASNRIRRLLYTQDGLIWCITERGVSAFDGRHFRTFTHKHGFPDGVELKAWLGQSGTDWWAWVRTEQGDIQLIHYQDNRLEQKQLPVALPMLSSYPADAELVYPYLWLSTAEGLYRIHLENSKQIEYIWQHPVGSEYPKIRHLYASLSKNTIWAAVEYLRDQFAFYRIDEKGTWEEYPHTRNHLIVSAYIDQQQNLWTISREGVVHAVQSNGMLLYHWHRGKGLPAYRINKVFQDRQQNYWIATSQNKLLYFHPDSFITFAENEGLENTEIWSIAQDSLQRIWVGTFGHHGLYYFDENRHIFLPAHFANEVPYLGRITAIVPINDENMLLGTYNGIWQYSLKTGYMQEVSQQLGIDNAKQVTSIYYDKPENVFWVATLGNGVYEVRSDTTICHNAQTAGLPSNFVRYVFKDSTGKIWICTTYGIACLYTNREWQIFTKDNAGLPNDYILQATEDAWGNIWFACLGGVLRYDGSQFRLYRKENGLKSNIVYSLQRVGNYLWIGTQDGATCWLIGPDGNIRRKRIFAESEGFTARENNAAAIFYDSRRRLWMGTVQGLHCFDYPKPFRDVPRGFVGIARTLLFLQPIDWAKQEFSQLYRAYDSILHFPKGLELYHAHNNLTFIFDAIDYLNAHKLEFSWWMEGLDQQWTSWSQRREITYAGLPAGSYRFWLNIRTADGDMLTEKPLQYSFRITPPFYATNWFYLLIMLLVGGGVFLLMWVRAERMRRQKERLEQLIRQARQDLESKNQELEEKSRQLEQQTRYLEQINTTKDRFFSILAHDIKGPLNSLTAFLDIMSNHLDEMSREDIQFMSTSLNRSVKNLYQLLENVLSWSRSQMGIIEYHFEELSIKNVVKENLHLLQMTAENKGIRLIDEVPASVLVYADYPSLNTVIRNLLSNAIKFTEPGGSVTIGASSEAKKVLVWVKDTGIGMSAEVRERLFRVDQRISTKGTANETGTGLGLILVKEFIEKNGGRIWVESEPYVGTTFFFSLPSSYRGTQTDVQDVSAGQPAS